MRASRDKDKEEELEAPAKLKIWWLVLATATAVVAVGLGLTLGPASLGVREVLLEVLDRLPFVDYDSGLSAREKAIVWEIRLPRVVLGLLVGSMLATAGASYQGVFRNPLADPYLLGVAAGAGFGATVAIVSDLGDGIGTFDAVPMLAFGGALVAVGGDQKLVLETGDIVKVVSDTASSIDTIVSVMEQT